MATPLQQNIIDEVKNLLASGNVADARRIACRASLRVAPLAWAEPPSYIDKGDWTRWPILVTNFFVWIAVSNPSRLTRGIVDPGSFSLATACAALSVLAAAEAIQANNKVDVIGCAVNSVDEASHYEGSASGIEAIAELKRKGSGSRMAVRPLWASENPYIDSWNAAKTTWMAEGKYWLFWIRWYDNVLAGVPQDLDFLSRVASIPMEVWQRGPEAVAERIEELVRPSEAPQGVEQVVPFGSEASVSEKRISTIRTAMQYNLPRLPATFDSVLSLIGLEIECLQRKNFRDEFDKDECIRQTRLLLSLNDTIEELRNVVPAQGEVTLEEAKKSERLLHVYAKKLADLPLARADEVVEGVWQTGKGFLRLGLLGVSAGLLASFGLPPVASVLAGSIVFAPKQMTDILRVARDALQKSPGVP